MEIQDIDIDLSELSQNPEEPLKLEDIYLMQEDSTGVPSDTIRLDIRKIIPKPTRPIKSIGTILAKKPDEISFPLDVKEMTNFDLIPTALAQEQFRWFGRENNFDFYEKKINEKTIRRYYYDCWVLQYSIDSNGDSIEGSFVWVRQGKSFLGYCF